MQWLVMTVILSVDLFYDDRCVWQSAAASLDLSYSSCTQLIYHRSSPTTVCRCTSMPTHGPLD